MKDLTMRQFLLGIRHHNPVLVDAIMEANNDTENDVINDTEGEGENDVISTFLKFLDGNPEPTSNEEKTTPEGKQSTQKKEYTDDDRKLREYLIDRDKKLQLGSVDVKSKLVTEVINYLTGISDALYSNKIPRNLADVITKDNIKEMKTYIDVELMAYVRYSGLLSFEKMLRKSSIHHTAIDPIKHPSKIKMFINRLKIAPSAQKRFGEEFMKEYQEYHKAYHKHRDMGMPENLKDALWGVSNTHEKHVSKPSYKTDLGIPNIDQNTSKIKRRALILEFLRGIGEINDGTPQKLENGDIERIGVGEPLIYKYPNIRKQTSEWLVEYNATKRGSVSEDAFQNKHDIPFAEYENDLAKIIYLSTGVELDNPRIYGVTIPPDITKLAERGKQFFSESNGVAIYKGSPISFDSTKWKNNCIRKYNNPKTGWDIDKIDLVDFTFVGGENLKLLTLDDLDVDDPE